MIGIIWIWKICWLYSVIFWFVVSYILNRGHHANSYLKQWVPSTYWIILVRVLHWINLTSHNLRSWDLEERFNLTSRVYGIYVWYPIREVCRHKSRGLLVFRHYYILSSRCCIENLSARSIQLLLVWEPKTTANEFIYS